MPCLPQALTSNFVLSVPFYLSDNHLPWLLPGQAGDLHVTPELPLLVLQPALPLAVIGINPVQLPVIGVC